MLPEWTTIAIYLVLVIRQVCGQTWTRVRVKYYNY